MIKHLHLPVKAHRRPDTASAASFKYNWEVTDKLKNSASETGLYANCALMWVTLADQEMKVTSLVHREKKSGAERL